MAGQRLFRAATSEKFTEAYEQLCLLHRGAHSEVWLCSTSAADVNKNCRYPSDNHSILNSESATGSCSTRQALGELAATPKSGPTSAGILTSAGASADEIRAYGNVPALGEPETSVQSECKGFERASVQQEKGRAARPPLQLSLGALDRGGGIDSPSPRTPKTPGSRRHVACRVVRKPTQGGSAISLALQREVALLEELSGKHPGIIGLHDVLETERSVRLVLELCKGGTLGSLVRQHGRLPEAGARLVFSQVASTVSFCHDHFVLLRNINADGVLLTSQATALYDMTSSTASASEACLPLPSSAQASGISAPIGHIQTRLSDFSAAVALKEGARTHGFAGSEHYASPEMLKGKRYSLAADVWSLGVLLAFLLTGRLPFAGAREGDFEGARLAILQGTLNFGLPEWEGVSEAARELVSGMLRSNGRFRMSAREVLVHPWFMEAQQKEHFFSPIIASESLKLPAVGLSEQPGKEELVAEGVLARPKTAPERVPEKATRSTLRRSSQQERRQTTVTPEEQQYCESPRDPAKSRRRRAGQQSTARVAKPGPLMLSEEDNLLWGFDQVPGKGGERKGATGSPATTPLAQTALLQRGMWSRLGDRDTKACVDDDALAHEVSLLLAEVQ